MTDVDVTSLTGLLDECRVELGAAVEELERSRSAHRAVESLLLAVLEHVPVPLVVVDAEGRLRAVGAAAEAAWGAALGDLAAGVPVLSDANLPELCRTAIEAGHVAASAAPDGFAVSVLEEPGTGVRYVVVSGQAGATG